MFVCHEKNCAALRADETTKVDNFMYISLSPQFSAAKKKPAAEAKPTSLAAKPKPKRVSVKTSPLQIAARLGQKAAALLKQEQRASENLRQTLIQTYGLAPNTSLETAETPVPIKLVLKKNGFVSLES